MGRINKLTGSVFANIVGTPKQTSEYYGFVHDLNPKLKSILEYKEDYVNLIRENEKTFARLALLETIILQLSSRELIMTGQTENLKVVKLREYVYVRHPFFKVGGLKDIRVLVGKTDKWKYKNDVSELIKNKGFIKLAITKLVNAMDSEINTNKFSYKKLEKVLEV